MKKLFASILLILTVALSACGAGNSSSSSSSRGSSNPEVESSALSSSALEEKTPVTENTGIIQAVVGKNCNYIYHMLAVSNCGYDNDYGRKYQSLHPQEELQTLKKYENEITVEGGEHTGRLYGLCVALPATLPDDISLPTYFEALADLFGSGDLEQNFEKYQGIYEQSFPIIGATVDFESLKAFYSANEPLKEQIAAISKVMHDNFSIYSDKVWEDSYAELSTIADELNKEFDAHDYASKWEETLDCKYNYDTFFAMMCNSMQNGPNCIDISYDKDVFYHEGEYASTAKLISHEFGIYLLKQALQNTGAFQEMAYYELTEGLAEYFNGLVSGGHTDWDWGDEYIQFYQQLREQEPEITVEDMFLRAVDTYLTAGTETSN